MTVIGSALPPSQLIALVRRVETGDRHALRDLHASLREPVSIRVRRTLSRAGDVRAVVDATFVEVFWMSRFHATADADVLAWVFDVAARRSAERLLIVHPEAHPRYHDEGGRLALAWLLEPARTRCGRR